MERKDLSGSGRGSRSSTGRQGQKEERNADGSRRRRKSVSPIPPLIELESVSSVSSIAQFSKPDIPPSTQDISPSSLDVTEDRSSRVRWSPELKEVQSYNPRLSPVSVPRSRSWDRGSTEELKGILSVKTQPDIHKSKLHDWLRNRQETASKERAKSASQRSLRSLQASLEASINVQIKPVEKTESAKAKDVVKSKEKAKTETESKDISGRRESAPREIDPRLPGVAVKRSLQTPEIKITTQASEGLQFEETKSCREDAWSADVGTIQRHTTGETSRVIHVKPVSSESVPPKIQPPLQDAGGASPIINVTPTPEEECSLSASRPFLSTEDFFRRPAKSIRPSGVMPEEYQGKEFMYSPLHGQTRTSQAVASQGSGGMAPVAIPTSAKIQKSQTKATILLHPKEETEEGQITPAPPKEDTEESQIYASRQPLYISHAPPSPTTNDDMETQELEESEYYAIDDADSTSSSGARTCCPCGPGLKALIRKFGKNRVAPDQVELIDEAADT